jgi:hypothetical protein
VTACGVRRYDINTHTHTHEPILRKESARKVTALVQAKRPRATSLRRTTTTTPFAAMEVGGAFAQP